MLLHNALSAVICGKSLNYSKYLSHISICIHQWLPPQCHNKKVSKAAGVHFAFNAHQLPVLMRTLPLFWSVVYKESVKLNT